MITAEGDFQPVSLFLVPIIALAFASTQLTWALFNVAVPLFLDQTYGLPFALIGIIMTLDNIIAFFVQPYIGTQSDQTRTRIGRRLPYIIPGMILGASFFFLIPFMRSYPIFVFLATIILFNLSMALYRSPAVSLMPDLVAKDKRSIGNGIVNLMGGIFSGASLFIAGGLLSDGNTTGAFGFVSIGVLVSLVILIAIVREPTYQEETDVLQEEGSAFDNLLAETRRVLYGQDKSYLFMLIAILCWFMAWNAVEAFYSIYVAREFLPNLDQVDAGGQASQVLFIFPIVFVVFTLVGGVLGSTIGRLRTMKIGLFFFTLSIFVAYFVEPASLFGINIAWENSYQIIFALAGASWGLINVNSIVVIWHHASDNGTGTGIYYAFASAAAILGPTLAGLLMDIDVTFLFPFSLVFLVLAMVSLLMVRTGEVDDLVEGTKFLNSEAIE